MKAEPCALCGNPPKLGWNPWVYFWECQTDGCHMGCVVTAGFTEVKATKKWNAEQKMRQKSKDASCVDERCESVEEAHARADGRVCSDGGLAGERGR